MARFEVFCADFRDTLASVSGASLVATSPPYADARTCYGTLSWEDYQELGEAIFAALAPGGHCLLNLGSPVRQLRANHGTERNLLPYRVLLDWADRIGFTAPDTLAFGRRGYPGEYKGRFRCDYEPLFWFRKPGPPMPIYRHRLSVKRAHSFMGGVIVGTNPDGSKRRQIATSKATADRGTLWDYGVVGNGHSGDRQIEAQRHPARWPYKLAADIVACFSDIGDLVIDPFLGGGTTLCAACDHGRRFIGGDLSQEWVDKSLALAESRYVRLSGKEVH